MQSMIETLDQLEGGTYGDKIIEIKSVYKNGKTTVQPVKDPLSGWYKGIPRLSEDDKRKLKFWAEPDSKFILKEGVVLDLNKEEHKIIWEWLKWQPALAMSYEECQMKPEAEFYVHIKHKEAVKNVSRKKQKYIAMKYITEDSPSNYPLRVKLLGLNMDGEDPIVIEEFLLDRAEHEPERIIKLYEDKNLSLRMLLLEAIEKRKIIIEPSGAYRYGNMFMGMSEDSVIDWMSAVENQSTVRLLEEDVSPKYIEEKTALLEEGPQDPTATEPIPEEFQPNTMKEKKPKAKKTLKR